MPQAPPTPQDRVLSVALQLAVPNNLQVHVTPHGPSFVARQEPREAVRLSGSGSGSIVPLDGDRLARWARAGAGRLGGVPVTRWGRVRSARVVGREAPKELMEAVWAVRPEGEGLTRDWAARVGE